MEDSIYSRKVTGEGGGGDGVGEGMVVGSL